MSKNLQDDFDFKIEIKPFESNNNENIPSNNQDTGTIDWKTTRELVFYKYLI